MSKKTKQEKRKKHMEKVLKDRANKEELHSWYRNFKSHLKCAICKEHRACAIEMHHVIPEEKSFSVFSGVRNGISVARLIQELKKTIPLCCNHHKAFHNGLLTKKENEKLTKFLIDRKEKQENGFEIYDLTLPEKKTRKRKSKPTFPIS